MSDSAFLKILLLEDNADDAWLIQMYLKRAGLQFSLIETTVKEEFINALEKEEFDLILCDHNLPSFDSMQALKAARSIYPHIPFIIISGKLHDDKAAQIIEAGADEFVPKDNFRSLVVIIQSVLDARKK